MWISKKKWYRTEKRIADLEEQIQSQQQFLIEHLNRHTDETDELRKVLDETQTNLIKNLTSIQDEMVKQVISELSH